MTTVASFASLDDLRRAFRALGGDGPPVTARQVSVPDRRTRTGSARWVTAAGEWAVLVCGCGGSPGATTMALSLATAADRARVVETCGGLASGLVYAATSELGTVERQWLRGTRDAVVLERRAELVSSPDDVPAPAALDAPLTIVDSSWDIGCLLESAGWLGDLARTALTVVLVSRATIPGLRRLEATASLIDLSRLVAVTVGARRWPRPVEQAAGPMVRRLRDEGRIVLVPHEPGLALAGLTPDPLPPSILRPAQTVLTLLEGLPS
ncbi:MAG: hypothetical protein LCH76_12095 [Actinobacteria bacterium]|nr:hypothetical protein [Actinomycetota bacterium]